MRVIFQKRIDSGIFGSDALEVFGALARHRPEDLPFCMEFWNGWFDHRGQPRVARSPEDAAASLAEILGAGGSANLYMAHGGTNFGTGAGANHHDHAGHDEYRPTVASYGYDAALDERGRQRRSSMRCVKNCSRLRRRTSWPRNCRACIRSCRRWRSR